MRYRVGLIAEILPSNLQNLWSKGDHVPDSPAVMRYTLPRFCCWFMTCSSAACRTVIRSHVSNMES